MFAISVALFAALAASALAVDWPSHVVPDPLLLPSPGGMVVEFVPVYVSSGGPKEFQTGTAGESPFESPASLTVEGSFRDVRESRWFYYISRTEVTVGLFSTVMRSAGRPGFLVGVEQMPATGLTWLQVQEFLTFYNIWISKKAGEELPHEEDRLKAFLRLPTEAEWEFAARGGLNVSPEIFTARTPYGGQSVELFESVGGPASSHNKLQPVAKLLPNVLGLHDMLGNAAEMTETTFQLYGDSGKTGGGVRKGGNFRTPPQDVRTSLRGEFPRYSMDGTSQGNSDLGFRLVLATLVFADVETVTQIAGRKDRPTPPEATDVATGRSIEVKKLASNVHGSTSSIFQTKPALTVSASTTLMSHLGALHLWQQTTILALSILIVAFLPGLLLLRRLRICNKTHGRVDARPIQRTTRPPCSQASALQTIETLQSKSEEISCLALAKSLCKAVAKLFGAPDKLSYPYKDDYNFLATANAMLSCGTSFGLVLPAAHTHEKLAEFLKAVDVLKFAPNHFSQGERISAIKAAKEVVQGTHTK